jgi:hypothetical protein
VSYVEIEFIVISVQTDDQAKDLTWNLCSFFCLFNREYMGYVRVRRRVWTSLGLFTETPILSHPPSNEKVAEVAVTLAMELIQHKPSFPDPKIPEREFL